MTEPTVMCVAGEASGDALLAPVVAHLRQRGARAIGVGGDRSAAAGLELLAHARDVAGHGLIEAAHTLPAVLGAWRRLRRALDGAVGVVLVDFPEVNLRLLRRAARRRIPAIYLAPPQAWAWRAQRAATLGRARWVGCLLPFEARWYAARGVDAVCIGHPLADRAPPRPPDRPGLALLPGSRAATVERLLPLQLAAATRLCQRHPDLTVHVAVAPTIDRAAIAHRFADAGLPGALHADADPALARSSVALAGAGTATLHAALARRPVLTLARLHPLTWAVARRLVHVEHTALPNLVLGRRAWPELWQADATPDAIADVIDPMLSHPERWDDAFDALRDAVHRPAGRTQLLDAVDGLLDAPPAQSQR